MITKAGRTYTRELIRGDSSAALGYLGIGTGTTANDDADTTIETEVLPRDGARKAVDKFQASAARKGKFVYELNSLEGLGSTISECGLMTAVTSGSLFNHIVFTGEAKDNTKRFRFTIVIEVKS